MKSSFFILLFSAVLVLTACVFEREETRAETEKTLPEKVKSENSNETKTPVLVELFTSEG